MQDVQEGQPPRPELQTQSEVFSQQTVAHRPHLTPRLAWGTGRPGHVHSVYGSFCCASQVVWRDKKVHKVKTLNSLDINWGKHDDLCPRDCVNVSNTAKEHLSSDLLLSGMD